MSDRGRDRRRVGPEQSIGLLFGAVFSIGVMLLVWVVSGLILIIVLVNHRVIPLYAESEGHSEWVPLVALVGTVVVTGALGLLAGFGVWRAVRSAFRPVRRRREPRASADPHATDRD